MMLLRQALVVAGLVLVLTVVALDIRHKEATLAEGRLVLLELQPVDPRSLIQGDYMDLRYSRRALPPPETVAALPSRGRVVLALDADGVGTFARLDDGSPLAEGEVRIGYRRQAQEEDLRLGSESFFFQEGDAPVYAVARFGMLRVDAEGRSILVGLAGADHHPLAPPPDQ
jgi:uncharacterized membrane-anchored protein